MYLMTTLLFPEHEKDDYQQVASDCIWSDPASEEQEESSVNQENGFGESLRGGGAICFGHKAVSDFLTQHDFSYIMRAHEAHAEGVAVSKGARVFTVFSTSKDHNQGSEAMAGCILVDFEKLQVINRSPAYRNQYVHRRDSMSIAKLSDEEIEQRIELGLITATPTEEGDDDEEENVHIEGDEWEDFDEEDDTDGSHDEEEEEIQYIIDSRRSSYVNPLYTVSSPPVSHGSNYIWSRPSSSFDLSNVTTANRKNRKHHRLSSLSEKSFDDEDEASTVDGSANDFDMESTEQENHLPIETKTNILLNSNATPAKRKNEL